MKLSILVFRSNVNFEDERIVNIINKFNSIEFIFVEHDINCKNNIEFHRNKKFRNSSVLKYKNYDEINVRNFSINFVSNEYVMFLDYKNINSIENLEKIIYFSENFDLFILNSNDLNSCEFECINFIFNVKFLCENNLWFYDVSFCHDYFQIIKSVCFGENVFLVNIDHEIVLQKMKDRKNIFDFLFNCIMTDVKNICQVDGVEKIHRFMMYLFDLIDFLNSSFMYDEMNSLVKIYNSYNLNIEIVESVVRNFKNFKDGIIKNLFLVHTPYHILLATCLSLNSKYVNCENSIFINDTFGCDEGLIRKLKSIFKNIYIEKDDPNKHPIDTLISVQNLLSGKVYDNIFVNNESEVKTQFIIGHHLKCDGKLIYVEDGTANYRSYEGKRLYNNPAIIKYFSKLLNFNIENIHFLGEHSRINERYFLYPEFVMDALKINAKNNSIDCNFLRDAIKLIYGNCNLEDEEFVLIALEHSSFTSIYKQYDMNLYSNLIESLAVSIKNLGKKVYLKYHPREDKEYLKFNFRDNDIEILNKTSAIESFFCKNMILISLHSTSLITFSKLFANQNAICIQKLMGNDESDLTQLFKNVGVFFPSSIDEIILGIRR